MSSGQKKMVSKVTSDRIFAREIDKEAYFVREEIYDRVGWG